MSEQPYEPAAPAADAPAGGREFTPEELAAARAQLQQQGEYAGVQGPAESGAELGMQALAAGAQADEVDPAALLRSIQKMQAQIDRLENEKRQANAPEVVTYATALRDHLAAKRAAHPVIDADPDHGFAPVIDQAEQLVTGAKDAAEHGHPGTLAADAEKIGKWVTRHARRFPHLDYSYILDLAEDAAAAVAKLAA